MIDLRRLNSCSMAEQPFRWALIDGLLSVKDGKALADSFPHDHFKSVEGHDGEKGYLYEARCLLGMEDRGPLHPENLSASWRQLANDLLSTEYRESMSRLTSVDLSTATLEVNVFHYGPNAWLGPHLDLEDKLITHVLYFNQHWNAQNGGCLRILGSPELGDILTEISPVVGHSVVLVRSANSWHAVTRVTDACTESRRSVTVTFYKPGSQTSMWPALNDELLHEYKGDVLRQPSQPLPRRLSRALWTR